MIRLGGVTIVRSDDPAELSFAADDTVIPWPERFVEDVIFDSRASVRSLCIVVLDPGLDDVSELIPAEANEVVQAFPLQRTDEGLGERVRLGGAGRTLDAVRSKNSA